MLNAQKRRCRSLWESTVDGPGLAAGAGAGEAAVAPTMSLEECLGGAERCSRGDMVLDSWDPILNFLFSFWEVLRVVHSFVL